MEAAPDKLQESGVHPMNSLELLREVRRLKQLKEKNELAVPEELLKTKYKKSYENLCSQLKQAQSELRAAYMKAVRVLGDIMSESVYVNPENKTDEWVHEQLVKAYEGSGMDPLVKEMCTAFWKFGEEEYLKKENNDGDR